MSKASDRALEAPNTQQSDGTIHDILDPSGCSWGDWTSYVQGYVLGFCCCGQPEQILDDLRERLEIMAWMSEGLKAGDTPNWGAGGDLLEVLNRGQGLFQAYWLDAEGFCEHGSSISGQWLEPAGYALLELLRKEADARPE